MGFNKFLGQRLELDRRSNFWVVHLREILDLWTSKKKFKMAQLENGREVDSLPTSKMRLLRRGRRGSNPSLRLRQPLHRPTLKIFKSDPVEDRVVGGGCEATTADAREDTCATALWSSMAAVSGSTPASLNGDRSLDRSCRNCGGCNKKSFLRPKSIFSMLVLLVSTHLLLLLSNQIQAVSANPAVPAVVSTTGKSAPFFYA